MKDNERLRKCQRLKTKEIKQLNVMWDQTVFFFRLNFKTEKGH